jgi:hypothetical protein
MEAQKEIARGVLNACYFSQFFFDLANLLAREDSETS